MQLGSEEYPTEWDMSSLVRSTVPDEVKAELDEYLSQIYDLEKRYKGKVGNLDAKGVLELLKAQDAALIPAIDVRDYMSLTFFVNTNDRIAQELHNHAQKVYTKMEIALKFIERQLPELLRKDSHIIDNPILIDYKHQLELLMSKSKYLLTEPEEQIILEKNKHGVQAWEQLHSEILGSLLFKIEVDGKMEEKNFGDLHSLSSYHTDRMIRKKGAQLFFSGLSEHKIPLSFAVRSICADYVDKVERRGLSSMLEESLNYNDVDKKTIDSLIQSLWEEGGIIHRYLALKAEIMGLERLGSWDLRVPVSSSEEDIPWNKACGIIVDLYSEFDNEIGTWVFNLIKSKHIDAYPKSGKRGGGFCADCYRQKGGWICLNFRESMDDMFAFAHEVGHCVHSYLRAQKQVFYTWSNVGPCMEETASLFGELLLTDYLLTKVEESEKIAILCKVLDRYRLICGHVFARYLFESSLYKNIKEGVYLDAERIASIWVESRDSVYGDTVDWLPEDRWDGIFPRHLYRNFMRFYNYPYIFGQVLVFALYRQYKTEGPEFVLKFKKILADSGSQSPKNLFADIGYDITSMEFWKLGISQAEEFIKSLEKTIR